MNTKVDCRFVVQDAAWLTEEEREKLAKRHRNQINAQGELVVASQASRSQNANVNDCVRKIQLLVDSLADDFGTRKAKRRQKTAATRSEGTAQKHLRSNGGKQNNKPVRTKKGKHRMWVWDH